MTLPNFGSVSTPIAAVATPPTDSPSSADDASKRIRKPYTITKSREIWTEPEHDKFLEALQLFDRDWKKIEAFIGSKTAIQIRSHAQKYFLKVQKSGTNEHLPPPRPKRKSAHPYPQKAAKNATTSCKTSPALTDRRSDLSCIAKVLPDFAQVYGFIGSVFDPNTSGHLQKLKKMDPIDVETVLLLMRNLSINLISPDFEGHRELLSTYEIDSDKENSDDVIDTLLDCQPEQVSPFGF